MSIEQVPGAAEKPKAKWETEPVTAAWEGDDERRVVLADGERRWTVDFENEETKQYWLTQRLNMDEALMRGKVRVGVTGPMTTEEGEDIPLFPKKCERALEDFRKSESERLETLRQAALEKEWPPERIEAMKNGTEPLPGQEAA